MPEVLQQPAPDRVRSRTATTSHSSITDAAPSASIDSVTVPIQFTPSGLSPLRQRRDPGFGTGDADPRDSGSARSKTEAQPAPGAGRADVSRRSSADPWMAPAQPPGGAGGGAGGDSCDTHPAGGAGAAAGHEELLKLAIPCDSADAAPPCATASSRGSRGVGVSQGVVFRSNTVGVSGLVSEKGPTREGTHCTHAEAMDGIDPQKLRVAVRHFLDLLGVIYDGEDVDEVEMGIWEFRQLFQNVFPQIIMNQELYLQTQRMFSEMDVDNSGALNIHEMITYLDGHQCARRDRKEPPTSTRDWIWLFVGTGKCEKYLDPKERAKSILAIQLFKLFSQFVIITAIIVAMVESLPEYQKEDGSEGTSTTFTLDTICIVWFTIEFMLYTFSWHSGGFTCHGYWTDMSTWVDLLSIVPYYFGFFTSPSGEGSGANSALSTVRSVRMMRLLRILRAVRDTRNPASSGTKAKLLESLSGAIPQITLFMVLIVITMAFSSSLIYYAEKGQARFDHAQKQWVWAESSTAGEPGEPTHFQSIPDALWWSIVTITTVGYGDKYPQSPWGKLIAGGVMLWSLLVVSLAMNLVSTASSQMADEARSVREYNSLVDQFLDGVIDWVQAGGEPGGTKALSFRKQHSGGAADDTSDGTGAHASPPRSRSGRTRFDATTISRGIGGLPGSAGKLGRVGSSAFGCPSPASEADVYASASPAELKILTTLKRLDRRIDGLDRRMDEVSMELRHLSDISPSLRAKKTFVPKDKQEPKSPKSPKGSPLSPKASRVPGRRGSESSPRSADRPGLLLPPDTAPFAKRRSSPKERRGSDDQEMSPGSKGRAGRRPSPLVPQDTALES